MSASSPTPGSIEVARSHSARSRVSGRQGARPTPQLPITVVVTPCQAVGVTSGYYLFNAAPYVLTLFIMIVSTSPKRSLRGAPAELSITST